MFHKLFAIVAILALAVSIIPAASSADSVAELSNAKPVQVKSTKSFDKTVDTLKKLVAKNGMMVMGEVNQGKIMSMTGSSLKAVSLFVGSPAVGKKLFNEDVGCAVAAPFRVTVYQDKAGKTIISYFKPSHLLAGFEGKTIPMVASNLDNKLAMLTAGAGK